MTTILMADDDKFFLQVVSRFLAAAGYQVSTARNGQEAVDLAGSLSLQSVQPGVPCRRRRSASGLGYRRGTDWRGGQNDRGGR